MSTPAFSPDSLKIFVACINKVPDPRSKRGQSYGTHYRTVAS